MTVLGLRGGGGAPIQAQAPAGRAPAPPQGDQMAPFVSTVLCDTELAWQQVFRANGQP